VAAKLLTKDEARRIAVGIAKLAELMRPSRQRTSPTAGLAKRATALSRFQVADAVSRGKADSE
jgi:hypothetical protein